MAGLGDQHMLPRFEVGKIIQRQVAEQQAGVMNAGLDRAEHLGITGQGVGWHQHQIAPGRIAVRCTGRETGNGGTDLQVTYAIAQRCHAAGQFETGTGRELGLLGRQVLPPQHVFPAQADGLHAHQHLTRAGHGRRNLFVLEHIGIAELMKTDHAGHRLPRA